MTLRLAGLAALSLLAGCEAPRPSASPPPAPPPQATQPATGATTAPAAPAQMADACTGQAESLTVIGDRGIGGTGVGSEAPVVADRGIGGTGVTGETGLVRGLPGTQTAERGGGGTGIVGALTGFRSLCINGVEVALDRPALVKVDGVALASATLRTGDVAAIEARGAANDLHVVSIGVRHEVSGPVAALSAAGDTIEIAGQIVLISPQTRIAAELHIGGWVAVSGLRDPGGAIHATRLDERAPGDVLVAGVPEQAEGGWQIGGLRLRLPPKLVPGADRLVLTGELSGNVLRVQQVSSDPLLPRRGTLQRMLVEGYPTLTGNEVSVAEGIEAGVGPSFGPPPPADQPVIVELVNTSASTLLAVAWHPAALIGAAGHGKSPTMPDQPVPSTPAPAPPMQTPALTPPSAPSAAPTASTAAATTTTSVTAATASTSTTTAGSSSDTASQSSTSTGAGGAPSTGSGSKAQLSVNSAGESQGNPPTPTPPERSPPTSIGEGQLGPGTPTVPTKGAGVDGGSDGPAPPAPSGGKAVANSASGTDNGTEGGSGGSTFGGGMNGSGSGKSDGGKDTKGSGNKGAGSESGAGLAGGAGGSPPAPGGGVGGAEQAGGSAGGAEGSGGSKGGESDRGGKDGKRGKDGKHRAAPAPPTPGHSAAAG